MEKREPSALIQELILRLNNQFKRDGYAVSMLHSHQGGEFLSANLLQFCACLGIDSKANNAYSPEGKSISNALSRS
ncbi:hypothetical protein PHMEG_00031397 [Phytophthora megakarya]|uniref:Integrase catalytic domain-containing protein n=1 Tax=Phytophthora megakarya TaxID=4795 RepID=A0A225UWT3_9STRA|nr:hypothetical protein PHMEG_00031397 [Phytophthora megakarya]